MTITEQAPPEASDVVAPVHIEPAPPKPPKPPRATDGGGREP